MTRIACALAGAIVAWSLVATTRAQSADRTTWDGVFTDAQAARGADLYAANCSLCHGPTLAGADGPPLTGVEFAGNWNGLTVADLSERIRTAMPPDNPGKLTAQERADVLAHILKIGAFPSGGVELSKDTQDLRQIRFRASK